MFLRNQLRKCIKFIVTGYVYLKFYEKFILKLKSLFSAKF